MKIQMGPIFLDTEDRREKNQVHVAVDRQTWADPHFSDLQACAAALKIARVLPASEIAVERRGCRTRIYQVRDVEEQLRRNPFIGMQGGIGNVEDPRWGMNIAPGQYISNSSLKAFKRKAHGPASARRENPSRLVLA